jgi:hypothetical protein
VAGRTPCAPAFYCQIAATFAHVQTSRRLNGRLDFLVRGTAAESPTKGTIIVVSRDRPQDVKLLREMAEKSKSRTADALVAC